MEKNDIIFFDLDGVLVSNKFFTTYYLDKVIEELSEINISLNRQDLLLKIFNLFNSLLISNNNEERVKAFDWDELIRILFKKKYGLEWTNKIEQFYNSTLLKDYVFLYSDVINNLKWLISQGYQLSLISNGLSKYQLRVLKVLDIDQYFQNIILPDHVNDIKPNPRIFNYGLSKYYKLIEKKNNKIIYIGDSIYFDSYGANLCKFHSILLYRSCNMKMKKRTIQERTKKFNEDKRLLRYIKKDILLSRFNLNDIDLNLLKPNKVIYSLNELRSFL